MSHKVHPKIFRIKNLGDWDSRWFDIKNFPKNLENDMLIRNYLEKKLKSAGVQGIEIERFTDTTKVIVNTSRPGVVIGRQGKGAEEIKKELQKKFAGQGVSIKLEIRELKNPWSNALFVAQNIAQQIERRMQFRRVMKTIIRKSEMNRDIKGIRLEVSGRLNGATIARREWLSKGRLPRQTLRSDLDYGFAEAKCTYGIIGVKVWLYKGEKFDK